jgi:hypothetical protein
VTAAAESKDGASGGEVGGTGVKRRPSILGPRGGEEGTSAEVTRATVGQGEGAAAGGRGMQGRGESPCDRDREPY